MKQLLLASVIAVGAVAPVTAGFHEDAEQGMRDMYCAAEEELAATIMMLRQLGAPMATTLGEDPTDRQRAFVMEAYRAPRERGKAAQLRAAEEFGNRAALACHERVKDGTQDSSR